jgi:hypothetical protein
MGGTKGFKVLQYDITIEHERGIQVLQDHYKKRISTSTKKSNRALYKKVIKTLQEIRDKKFYTTAEKIWLNDVRLNIIEIKRFKKKFDI